MRIACLLALAFALGAAPARAEDAAMHAAKRHYESGEKLFALGEFDKALEQYQQAFDAKPLPDFLYNIGQCYRNLGDLDQAIFSFQKYLQLAPNAPDRGKVEQLIDDLEHRRDSERAQQVAPPPEHPAQGPAQPPALRPPHAVAHRPIYKQWWFWTGIAVVAVAGGTIGLAEGLKSSPPATDLGNINFSR